VFPPGIRTGFLVPLRMKVLPCMLVWTKMLFDQLAYRAGGGNSVAAAASV